MFIASIHKRFALQRSAMWAETCCSYGAKKLGKAEAINILLLRSKAINSGSCWFRVLRRSTMFIAISHKTICAP